MVKGFLNLPWFLWAALALIVAVIYSFVWPQKAVVTTTGLRFLVLRWERGLVWALLATSFVLRGLSPSLHGMANLIALAGGLMYMLFIVMTFLVK